MPHRSVPRFAFLFVWVISCAFLFGARQAGAQWLPRNAVRQTEQLPDGVFVTMETGYLRFTVCSESIVHVVYSLERDVPDAANFLIVKKSWPKAEFTFQGSDPKTATLRTSALRIEISKAD